MRRITGFLFLGTPLAVVIAVSAIGSGPTASGNSRAAVVTDGAAPRRPALPRLAYQGVTSCSAASCHGAAGEPGTEGCEYSTWANEDRHARAYRVLFEPRSRLMVRNYRHLASVDEARPQHDVECLRCHSPAALPPSEGGGGPLSASAADGVGCESCHGPAERYLTVHYTRGFRTLDPIRKRDEYGLLPMTNLAERVLQCATCHVGREGQEVNHDLIAAGHPRLRFEYATYQRNEPPHWKEKAYGPDFEVRAWAIGQVASAEAGLELLHSRAARAGASHDPAPWPELAEYSCYSCHHDLQPRSWRQNLLAEGRTPGVVRWGTWYDPLLDELAGAGPFGSRPELRDYHDLVRLMDGRRAPPAAEVARRSAAAAAELRRWLSEFESSAERDSVARPVSPAQTRAMLRSVLTRPAGPRDVANWEWDQATQRYLAAASLTRQLADSDPRVGEVLRPPLRQARQLLRFPGGFDSPTGFSPASYLDALRRVRDALDTIGASP